MLDLIVRELKVKGYTVEGIITESGSYVILKATRNKNSVVAVKVPRELALRGVTLTETSLKSAAERMLREIEVLEALRGDPGVVSLIDVVELRVSWPSGRSVVIPLAIVEYAESSLADMIRSGRGSWEFYVKALAKVARVLEQAHSQGFCHLDVRPENILVARGEPKLADFAGRCDEPLEVIPPREFAAPEQLEVGGRVGPWTDVYQLAVNYLHLLGLTPSTANREDLPHPLGKALSPNPSERPSIRDLREFLEGEALKASKNLGVNMGVLGERLAIRVPQRTRLKGLVLLSRGLSEPHGGVIVSVEKGWALLPGGLKPGVYSLWLKSDHGLERIGVVSVPEKPCFSEECFSCEVRVVGERSKGRLLVAALGAGIGYLVGLAVAGLVAAAAMALIFATLGAGIGGLVGALISLVRGEKGSNALRIIIHSTVISALAFAVLGVIFNFPGLVKSIESAADIGSTIGLIVGAIVGYNLAPRIVGLAYKVTPSIAMIMSLEFDVKGSYTVTCGKCRPQILEVAGKKLVLAPRVKGFLKGSLKLGEGNKVEGVEYIVEVPVDAVIKASESLKYVKTEFMVEELEARERRLMIVPAA